MTLQRMVPANRVTLRPRRSLICARCACPAVMVYPNLTVPMFVFSACLVRDRVRLCAYYKHTKTTKTTKQQEACKTEASSERV
jgi:hypothetical protein